MSRNADRDMNSRNRIHPAPSRHKSYGLKILNQNFTEISYEVYNKNDRLQKFMENYIKKDDGEPTDAYGEIEFGRRPSTVKYVRVSKTTNENILFTLLKDHWGLKMPNLIISVTGGAKNFSMRPQLREAFGKSLIKVSESTGAWITTGGTHAGVMKHVGKAVKNYALIKDEKNSVVAIGIAPWGTIYGNDLLVNKSPKQFLHPKMYDPDEKNQGNMVTLDPNHTHFILVDDGTESYGGEIELRAKLEGLVASKERRDGVKVMIVCVIVQGGPGSLKTVHESVKKGTPVVIVQGSGGWADVLAAAFHSSSISDKRIKEFLLDNNMEKSTEDEEFPEWSNMVKECVRARNLMSVFEYDPTDKGYDLDIAILQALLKAGAEENQISEQLNLAMAWNRSDIARSHILTDDAIIGKDVLAKKFFKALRQNKYGFCQLFLEFGVDLKDFCTVGEVLNLYRALPERSVVYRKLYKYRNGKNFELEDVGK